MTKFYLLVKRVLPVLFLVSCYTMVLAQGKAVSGRVTSADDGSAVPGVNILEKGTSNGTVTDADGNYRITVGDNATLVFSFVGYATQEVVVGDQTSVTIAMLSDVTALSEVVVVGYGSQEKKEITGAVVSLKSESFNKGNINDPAQLLQGKIAGVSVSKPGSDPNENFTIRLRGVTSAGATAPLIVVDGVIGATLNNIDPNDIATMDVLKDGSAAAIYGSRGSAGVILITTKKGKSGKTTVEVNSYIASDKISRSVPVMSTSEYLGIGGNNLGASTEWLDKVTRSGATMVNNLRVSGGAGNTVYSASVNFRNVEGILLNSGFDQINGRFNLQQSALKNKVRMQFDMSATTRKTNYSFQEALRYAAIYNPTAPILEPDPVNTPNPFGSPYFERTLFDNFNPVAIINQNVNEAKRNTINLSGRVEIDLIPGLTAVLSTALQKESELTGQYYGRNANFRGFNRKGLAYRNADDRDFTLFEGYGIYTKQLSELNLAVTGGYSFQQSNDQGFSTVTGNFLSDGLGYNQLQNSQDLPNGITTLGSYASPDSRIIAFFGRVNLNYKETYLLSASLRHEGSSRLGVTNRYGDFPAVSGAVVLSNLFEIPNVNTLKLRVGYGVTGALPSGNGFSQTQFFQQQSYNYSGGVLIPVYSTGIAPNPDLKWEQKAEINAGLEFGLMNNRLTGSLDVYQRTATDFILLRNVDPSKFVASQQYQNVGEIQTNGIELAVTYAVIPSGNFTWSTTLVGSSYKSTLKSLYAGTETAIGLPELAAGMGAPGQNNTYPISNIAGEQVGTIFGPQFSGTVDSGGSPLMIAKDGSLKLGTDAAFTRADHRILGHGLPSFELGWTNQMTFSNWDFNFFLRGSFGHSLVNSWRAFYEPIIPGQINSYNRVTTEFSRSDIKDAQFSSYYVEKAGFLKLDNASLGYNFKFATGSSISKLRVYLSGNNLFVITNYTGVDPEARLEDRNSADNGGFTSTGTNPLAPGIERRSTYFLARTVTLGFNITF